MKIKEFEITNPNKIVYKSGKVRKLDVINYYCDIAERMMPFVKNRILTVVRCHNGCDNACFFKKHPTTDKKFINAINLGEQEYFYLKDPIELVYQVQMGTIEFHIWPSTIQNINNPNFMVFDLDPAADLSLDKLRDGVKIIKELLDKLNLTSFLKTSGGKGYHIVVPFCGKTNWESFSDLSKQIAILLENENPSIFTTNIRKKSRKGKIFIDYLRNAEGSTCVAPYSLRARKTPSISMPIEWKDLDKIKPNEVTIFNYKDFLANPWKDFFEIKQKIKG